MSKCPNCGCTWDEKRKSSSKKKDSPKVSGKNVRLVLQRFVVIAIALLGIFVALSQLGGI